MSYHFAWVVIISGWVWSGFCLLRSAKKGDLKNLDWEKFKIIYLFIASTLALVMSVIYYARVLLSF